VAVTAIGAQVLDIRWMLDCCQMYVSAKKGEISETGSGCWHKMRGKRSGDDT